MPHIIISYRRADTDAIAGRIRDRLASHFGDQSIFMDVDSIPFGIDFRDHIKKALAANDILVAVIGPKWLGHGRGGLLRIMEETDPVRIEVETAIKSGSAVIPVLVAGARMPKTADLPDSLKDFAYRNAAEVDAGRDFHQHMERLIRSMDTILAAKYPQQGGEAAAAAAKPIIVPTAPEPAQTASAPQPAAPPAPQPKASEPAVAMAAAKVPPTPSPQPARSSARLIVYPLAAVVIAALGAGGTWLYLRKPTETPAATAPPKIEVPIQAAVPSGPVPGSAMATADCKLSGPTAFADDFKAPDPAWMLTKEVSYFTDGQLALKPIENKIIRTTYPTLRYNNLTICAKLRSPSPLTSNDTDTDGGVMFWATDISNFYLASIYPNGVYSVYRMADDNWAQVVPKTKFEGIKTGPGAINEIQVTTSDSTATLFINGTKALDFRGQPPKDSGIIGVYASSAKEERNEWRVLNVAVSDPAQPQQTAAKAPAPKVGPGCKPARKAAFEDNFKTADPGWGIAGATRASVADNSLVLKPLAGKATEQLYPSLLFANATICAQVRSPTQMNDINDTANGGVVFWGVDRSNYYTAAVFPNGQFGIYRMFGNKWSSISPSGKSANVKAGLGATNELMVTFKGSVGALYINGQKTFEFRGQPPKNGGTIGVFAGAEDTQETEWRFMNVAVVEND